ncbi:AAA family ATPase, partial [Saccharomonospora saliphila]|uniref:AAA family ATPase n=1 Tax=Saccharomonospora saliphila TaxID=369829 RepID=UPI000662A044
MLAVWDDTPAHAHAVRGRDRELATLTGALDDAARGTGTARVVLGRPGLGTTTLLDAVVARADGARVLRVRGTAAEADVPFAGLHQLVRPLEHLLSRLPEEHAEALRRVLSLDPETGPGASHPATHALFAAAAAEGTTVCCVDAAHELDAASLSALGFAARRLDHLGVLLVLAADHAISPGRAESLTGLPTLRLGPLDDDAARELLRDRLGAIPQDLGDSLLDLARGNPAALTELASAVTVDQLSGRADPPRALPPD